MRSIKGWTLFVCLLATAGAAWSQEPPKAALPASPGNPLIAYQRTVYEGVKGILLRSAEKMPEESYGFRPVDSVRTFGQILGHVAASQYFFCSTALGEKSPAPKADATKASKADVAAGLKAAFAYCDGAWNRIDDASANQMVKLMGADAPRLGVLSVNSLHSVEHYGSLVTYMRMKGLVPPTSEPEFQPGAKK